MSERLEQARSYHAAIRDVLMREWDPIGVADMPVVSGRGLLGKVGRVSGRRATVILLTDRDSGVGVRDARSGVVGVLNGSPDSRVQSLDPPDVKSDIKVGDQLVTLGSAEGPFPADIPVGRVLTVRNLDAWYPAFNVQTGQRLYLAPKARVRVW